MLVSFPESMSTCQVGSAERNKKCVFREQSGNDLLPEEIQAGLAEVVG